MKCTSKTPLQWKELDDKDTLMSSWLTQRNKAFCLFSHHESHIFHSWSHTDHMLCLVSVQAIPHDKGVAWIQGRKGLFFSLLFWHQLDISLHVPTLHIRTEYLNITNIFISRHLVKKGVGRHKWDKRVFEMTLSPLSSKRKSPSKSVHIHMELVILLQSL